MRLKILFVSILLALCVMSCSEGKITDLGIITDFDVKTGWPDVTIFTLSTGTKIAVRGVWCVSTGQHLIYRGHEGFFCNKPFFETVFIKE